LLDSLLQEFQKRFIVIGQYGYPGDGRNAGRSDGPE